ncbi:hypothetical protein GKZ68_10465 [Hymenobacter sp. BRD128]|uniref:hypothetical protein n=1 Tax=Hymenobacter sp. BRD128 TaxID=2675878 RepID=UPI0015672D54|nr:hypothetical protein [Hymenobacter sp. BRD128]QKG57013.1 hypothetical protein GKZ68_10465 [Hymenobacter sp. BRD128]
MSQTLVTAGQSLVDVALQELGSVETLFDLADAQGLAITDLLTPGQVLTVPASVASQPGIVTYFSQRTQRINTGDEAVPVPPLNAQRYFSNLFFSPDTYA